MQLVSNQSAGSQAWCSNTLYATAGWQHFSDKCLWLCLLQTPLWLNMYYSFFRCYLEAPEVPAVNKDGATERKKCNIPSCLRKRNKTTQLHNTKDKYTQLWKYVIIQYFLDPPLNSIPQGGWSDNSVGESIYCSCTGPSLGTSIHKATHNCP